MGNLAENLQLINEYITIKRAIRQRKDISHYFGWRDYSFNIYRRLRREKYQVRKILREKGFTKEELKRYSKDGCTNSSNNNEYNTIYARNKYGRTI